MVDRIAGAFKVLLKGSNGDSSTPRPSFVTQGQLKAHEDKDDSRFQRMDETATQRHTDTLDRISAVDKNLAELTGYLKAKLP